MFEEQTVEKYIKTHGKTRKIITYISPKCELRKLHRQLNETLATSTYPSIFAKAYYPGKGILDNAYTHYYGDIFIKLDIENFFASINHVRLEQNLHMEMNKRTKVSHDQCRRIVETCTCGYKGLPLGFITSPILSNIFLKDFDSLLYGYLRTLNLSHMIYTRYADDLIISFKYEPGYKVIASDIIAHVKKYLRHYKLRLNKGKTQVINFLDSKQVKITGLNLVLLPSGRRNITVGNALKNKLFWDAVDCYENPGIYSDFEVRRFNGLLSFILSIEGDGYQDCYSKNMLALIRGYGFDDFQSFVNSLYSRTMENCYFESTSSGISLRDLKIVSQKEVICAPVNRRILVNAGPGTGKTWTLIERIIYLVQKGTDPETIQVLCFSRAAVDVVRKRMLKAIEEGRAELLVNRVDIRTFDSFASQILYWVRDSGHDEVKKNFRIEALSYDERIEKFIEVINALPTLIEQCEHLIVDEVQDLVLSRARMILEMIRLLPKDSGITLFGDACQAIYDYQVEYGISSTDFYTIIENTSQFEHLSFDCNYRQKPGLQNYCEGYRKTILLGDMVACDNELFKINRQLPQYETMNIYRFENGSLDDLLKIGNVGILTRSNAEALKISGWFHRKKIIHTLQRRLADNYLNGWIAALFNRLSYGLYNEELFVRNFTTLVSDETKDNADPYEIWRTIVAFANNNSRSVSVGNMLRGIRDFGKNNGLYINNPNTSITVSTVHRSKGREFDSVIILDHLLSDSIPSQEEHRVNYVALSRAKQRMYKAMIPKVYFKSLDNRRCFSTERSRRNGKVYLEYFEVGRPGDFDLISFCKKEGVQDFLRNNIGQLRGKEVYLKRTEGRISGSVSYAMILNENGMILGDTGISFGADLERAIKIVKNLPWHASVYDYLFPKRFTGIFIMDIASEIGMVQGNEIGVQEFDGLITWNIVLAEGYAKAEYHD